MEQVNFHREVSKDNLQRLRDAADKVHAGELTKSEYNELKEVIISDSPVIPWTNEDIKDSE